MFNTIVIFTKHYPFNNGKAPAESFFENEIPFLSKRADKILIIALDAVEGCEQTISLPPNVRAYAVSDRRMKKAGYLALYFLKSLFWQEKEIKQERKKNHSFLKNMYLYYFVAKSDYYQKCMKSIFDNEKIEDSEQNLIYNFWFYTYARAALKTKEYYLRKSKICSRAHRYDLYEYRNRLDYLPLREYLLENMDKVFPCSEDGTKYLQGRYGKYENKIITSYLGSPDYGVTQVAKDNGVFCIVSCSRVVPVKRVNRILEICECLRSNHPDMRFHWIHIGDGTLFKELEAKAESLIREGWITLLGNMANSDVLKFYAQTRIDLFINMSESEGLPISIMEASSFGIPILATNVGGTKEIVKNEKNGWLIESEMKVSSVAEKVYQISQMTDSKYLDIRKSAREIWQENFQIRKNTEKMLEYMENKSK